MAGSPKKRERRIRWKEWAARACAIDELCDHIAGGGNLYAWTVANDFPYSTAHVWVESDPARSDRYARAREARANLLADQIVEIADEPPPMVATAFGEHVDAAAVAHQKLRIEARKWVAAKLQPGRYGDRMEVAGSKDAPLTHRHEHVHSLSDAELERIAVAASRSA